MRPFGDRVPAWPPLAGVFALGGAAVVAVAAPLLAAVPAAVAGLERTSPAIVLLAAVLTAAGIIAVVGVIAPLTRPLTGEQLGLRAPGDLPAALIVAVLFGGLTSPAGQPGMAVLSMLLGLALCGLYLGTGSLLPGIALASAASAVALGAACALAPAATAGLAAGCALASVALGAVPARQRLGAARRPVLRGSAA
jgi:hypothetical protein